MSLPAELAIVPVQKPLEAVVRVPGSKSFTNRAFIVAALAEGTSRLDGVLDSQDTRVMVDGLGRLGIAVDWDQDQRRATVAGSAGRLPVASADLFLANSGTSIRFLAAMVSLGPGPYRLDGIARMRQRPIGDLLVGLRQLGVDAIAANGNDCPPVEIRGGEISGGRVQIRGDVSSQFLSALLMVAPYAKGPLTIEVESSLVSRPYIDMTLACMADFGVRPEVAATRFHFAGGQIYRGTHYAIEPDASSASYFFAAAAITGGRVTVDGLGSTSRQGDLRFVDLLARMGCQVEQTAVRTTVIGGELRGIDADLCDLSDTVPTLAAVACFADTPTVIRNVEHIRHKETDRLAALATELRKAGIGVDERPDGLTITPGDIRPTAFDTYDDHRMAMSLSLLGLRTAGIVIRDPGCTQKTYPDFFSDLAAVCERQPH